MNTFHKVPGDYPGPRPTPVTEPTDLATDYLCKLQSLIGYVERGSDGPSKVFANTVKTALKERGEWLAYWDDKRGER